MTPKWLRGRPLPPPKRVAFEFARGKTSATEHHISLLQVYTFVFNISANAFGLSPKCYPPADNEIGGDKHDDHRRWSDADDSFRCIGPTEPRVDKCDKTQPRSPTAGN